MYDKLRKFPRLNTKSVLHVAPFNGMETEWLRLSHDISGGGCRFMSEQQYGVGIMLSMKIVLMNKTINPTCRVAWEKPSGDDHFDVGVEFLILSKEEHDDIARYVSSCEGISEAS